MKLRRLSASAALQLVAVMVLLAVTPAPAAPAPAASLTPVTGFGANPTDLNMYVYVPARVAPRPALLVAIHYCTGSAQAFFNGGAHDFVTAADQYGYIIVFPEATRDGHCFDVYSPQALTRDGGSDPVGIISMVIYASRRYHVDRDRVFVTGVSSGAMMTNVLAAEYPDVFAAGSAFSGVPAGCFATTGGSTWNSQCSGGQLTKTGQEWGDLARSMYPSYQGRYPRMQLWHGTADTTLSYVNLGEEVKQWTNLGQVSQAAVSTDNPEPNWTRTRYGGAGNMAAVEGIAVNGAGHTLPQSLMDSFAITFFGLAGAAHGNPLASTFQWRSSDVLMSPKPDSTHPIVSVKDPTVVRYRDQWLVYATTANTSGNWSLEFLSFQNWNDAASATPYYLDRSAIGTGYRAAPQLFYFAPQNLWYLVYQTGLPSYSTTTDPTKPESWSAPRNFMDSMPDIIRQNIGSGFWVDMWVICDDVNCYLFSSDDNGHLYRSQTTVTDFPNGFGNTVIALDDPGRFRLFEASNVYRVDGTDSYLLLVEAIGASGRYFRSWTSNRLDGLWTPLAVSETNPFAGFTNVTFNGSSTWTTSISHGEMIRSGYDQTLTIDPDNLQYLYQGVDPTVNTSYSQLPWRLGLLTQTPAG